MSVLTGSQEVTGLMLQSGIVEIDHEIYSTVILSLPLIQERMGTEYWLTA